MKRQILFRAKTLNKGEWVQSMTIANGTIERKRHNLYMEVGNDKWKGVDPDTLGQYTGVDDKNGKRIFEGDIVRIHKDIGFDNIGVVVFKDGCFGVEYDSYKPKCFHPLCKTTDEWRDMNATIPIKITFEVLGNIFDDSLILAN